MPVDFSKTADAALRYALNLVRRFDAHLVALQVVEAYPADYLAGITSANTLQIKQARARLRKLYIRFLGYDPASAEAVVKFGKPHKEVAKDMDIDLVVIATHGYTGFKHIQLESTAEMVVRYASCPVLVERGQQESVLRKGLEGYRGARTSR